MNTAPNPHAGEQDSNKPVSIPGNWDDHTKKLIQKYPKLTDTDLAFEFGKEGELIARIESRLDMNSDEAADVVRNG